MQFGWVFLELCLFEVLYVCRGIVGHVTPIGRLSATTVPVSALPDRWVSIFGFSVLSGWDFLIGTRACSCDLCREVRYFCCYASIYSWVL